MLSLDDALYGLRNLIIGDDEQTRILEYRDELAAEARALLDAGRYEAAYELAIAEAIAQVSRPVLETAAARWAAEWNAAGDGFDDERDASDREVEVTAAELLVAWDAIAARATARP